MVNFPSGLRELSQLGDGVLLAHLTDEIAQLMLDSGPSWPTLGFPAPVGPEPLPDATAGWWSAAQLEPKPAASARAAPSRPSRGHSAADRNVVAVVSG